MTQRINVFYSQAYINADRIILLGPCMDEIALLAPFSPSTRQIVKEDRYNFISIRVKSPHCANIPSGDVLCITRPTYNA